MNSKEAFDRWEDSLKDWPVSSESWDAGVAWARTEAVKACQEKEQELKAHNALQPAVNDVVAWPFIGAIEERLK